MTPITQEYLDGQASRLRGILEAAVKGNINAPKDKIWECFVFESLDGWEYYDGGRHASCYTHKAYTSIVLKITGMSIDMANQMSDFLNLNKGDPYLPLHSMVTNNIWIAEKCMPNTGKFDSRFGIVDDDIEDYDGSIQFSLLDYDIQEKIRQFSPWIELPLMSFNIGWRKNQPVFIDLDFN